jgi:arsenite methyltransferase
MDDIREAVKAHYAAAITEVRAASGQGSCCAKAADTHSQQERDCCAKTPDQQERDCCAQESFAAGKYDPEYRDGVPSDLVQASFGCGNPVMVAALNLGERVLDLGSGGGLDVLLSARRVGETGKAYGLDMTDEMLRAARQNAERAGATNVEFLKGHIEDIPLPDASIDVVISNCVINLSPNKEAVFNEIHRVLAPGGRLGIADIVCDDGLSPQQRADLGDWAECAAGALSRSEYQQGLAARGFTDVEVVYTDSFPNGANAALIRATKPAV